MFLKNINKSSEVIAVVIFLILLPAESFCQLLDTLSSSVIAEDNGRAFDTQLTSGDTNEFFPASPDDENRPLSDSAITENTPSGKNGESKEFRKSQTVIFKRKFNKIKTVSRAATAEDVMQGIIIKTSCLNSEIIIGDKSFKFDSVLYVNTPPGRYRLLVKAEGKSTRSQYVNIMDGSIKVINSSLRTVRFILGGTIGAALYDLRFGCIGNADLGFDIASSHFLGLTGSIAYGFYKNEYLTKKDLIAPDTIKMRDVFLMGCGLTYGYTGIHFRKYTTLIPKISIGRWKLGERTTYYVDYESNKRQDLNFYIEDWEKIQRKCYYLKPGIELRIGQRKFGLRLNVENYIGENIGPLTINFGAFFRMF